MKIYKVNVDENPSLAGQFGIKSIPTIVIFDDGVRVKEVVGLRPKEEIIEKLTVYQEKIELLLLKQQLFCLFFR